MLSKYVLKEKGKGLSSNDFTNNDVQKLNSIEVGAQVNKIETLTINGNIPVFPDSNKNVNINIPTKVSQLENDSAFAKLIGASEFEDYSDSYVGKSKISFQDEKNIAIGKNANADDGGIAIGENTSTSETYDVNIADELKHNVETDIWEGKFEESTVAIKNKNGTNLTELDTVISNLSDEIQNRCDADGALHDSISTIEDLIPNQATPLNQLADKSFVNSSIQTTTANFRGNWGNWAEVPTDSSLYPQDYLGNTTPTPNDYMVVQNANDYVETTLYGTWRFKYNGDWDVDGKDGWLPEYQVNEEPFTSEQLYAINSGITCAKVTQYDNHIQDTNNPHCVTKCQIGLENVCNLGTDNSVTQGSTNNVSSCAVYNAICDLTSCEGTVTICDTCENQNIPLALCTDVTSVGKSTCCSLTYNPTTGELCSASLTSLTNRVSTLEQCTQQQSVNKVLSTGKAVEDYLEFDGQFNVSSAQIVTATIGNIALDETTTTVDDVVLSVDDLILVKNQTDATENGVYVVSNDTWVRASDFNTPSKLKGQILKISDGTINKGKMFYMVNEIVGVSFTDDVYIAEYFGSVDPLANKLIMRDSYGRAQVSAPSTSCDIARKYEIDSLYGNDTPQPLGTANVGTCTTFARSDHVHPSYFSSDIQFQGCCGTTNIVQIKDACDNNGYGLLVGAGGLTVIGAGESYNTFYNCSTCVPTNEYMFITSDQTVSIITNLQAGWDCRKTFTFNNAGVLTATTFCGNTNGTHVGNVYATPPATNTSCCVVIRARCCNASAITNKDFTFCVDGYMRGNVCGNIIGSMMQSPLPATSTSCCVIIRARCCNASAVTNKNFMFCADGYMYGNVCGNVCGIALNSVYSMISNSSCGIRNRWDILCAFCRGRSSCCFCFELCTTSDILLFNRNNLLGQVCLCYYPAETWLVGSTTYGSHTGCVYNQVGYYKGSTTTWDESCAILSFLCASGYGALTVKCVYNNMVISVN